MKLSYSKKNNTGFGLVEVLVTTFVAVGLLSIAALQGDLIGSSRINKTRAECLALANAKIEQLRDKIEKSGANSYAGIQNSTESSLSGITEVFRRSVTVDTLTAPDRKDINVTVRWGAHDSENHCMIQSVISYTNPGNSVLAADVGATILSGSSPNANSSDDISKYVDITGLGHSPGDVATINGNTFIALDIQTIGGVSKQKGVISGSCASYSQFENDLYTRRVDHDGLIGNEAIELFEARTISSDIYCIPRVRYDGGVIIPISGIVYSKVVIAGITMALDLFNINASESGTYCVFKPAAGATEAPYTCYVGGNCTYGPAGSTGFEADPTQCPNPAVSAHKVGPGGWRGKVGLLGIAENNYNVCFAEEVASEPATLDTARNYFTGNAGLNEGINKPYQCHDLWIIEPPTPTKADVHAECAKWANSSTAPIVHTGNALASKNIERTISGNNVFDPTPDVTQCSTTYP